MLIDLLPFFHPPPFIEEISFDKLASYRLQSETSRAIHQEKSNLYIVC